MGLEALGDAGIGVVAAVLIIREVLSYLKAREAREAASKGDDDGDCDEALGKLDSIDGKLDDLAGATLQMSAILSRTDPDGLPLCYTPRSLVSTLEKLASSVDRLGERIR
ncbi:hypothetical protein CMI37_06360 [Candidatus Pacearchaeota archaeon]|nr:hypothetical protein [Candidatus Pacearchaeota archaeon]|tara:strand:- start:773 stop:1102 length:330 start_codon:yes stop_codon:yes gene_type:complete